MPTECSSPINRKSTEGLVLSPGARSMPGAAKDSVPSQTGGTGSSAPVAAAHGALPEPNLRSDALTPVEWHLQRHALLRLGRE
jgi:hypothetical protein